ncbi:MAG TPA: hypothetical protein VI300_31800, partial [Solirubrobacter sp.]
GGFIPGFGTHTVEHRAIDPAGNYSTPESYKATVLPGGSPTCTTTVTGTQASVTVATGVTCLTGATVTGAVTVAAGASAVLKNTTVGGALTTTGAEAVQLFGSTVTGAARISGSTRDVTIAGSTFRAGLALTGNTQVSANDRYSRLAGAYGPILAGSAVNGLLECSANSADVKDFGAPNTIRGGYSGCALAAVTPEAPVGGSVPATLALTLGAPAAFGAFTPGITKTYAAQTTANVISTAGDAALTVADPSSVATGRLVNGTFSLPQPLKVAGQNFPATVKTYAAPVSNDPVTIAFAQTVNATDPLRTGTYAKTLTFTLSTTTP